MTDEQRELERLRAANKELTARNGRLHREVHLLRERLNYPLATTDEETLSELSKLENT